MKKGGRLLRLSGLSTRVVSGTRGDQGRTVGPGALRTGVSGIQTRVPGVPGGRSTQRPLISPGLEGVTFPVKGVSVCVTEPLPSCGLAVTIRQFFRDYHPVPVHSVARSDP